MRISSDHIIRLELALIVLLMAIISLGVYWHFRAGPETSANAAELQEALDAQKRAEEQGKKTNEELKGIRKELERANDERFPAVQAGRGQPVDYSQWPKAPRRR
jgi:hypothetical protein